MIAYIDVNLCIGNAERAKGGKLVNIENILREYKINKSKVETTLARIEAWKSALNNTDYLLYLVKTSSKEIGMPRGTGIQGSTVETIALDTEEGVELIKEWIREDESRIFPLQTEIEQIDIALKSLTTGEKFVIECKYFDNMFWSNIEFSFNETYRGKNYITIERLRQINREALAKLTDILKPFYSRHTLIEN